MIGLPPGHRYEFLHVQAKTDVGGSSRQPTGVHY